MVERFFSLRREESIESEREGGEMVRVGKWSILSRIVDWSAECVRTLRKDVRGAWTVAVLMVAISAVAVEKRGLADVGSAGTSLAIKASSPTRSGRGCA